MTAFDEVYNKIVNNCLPAKLNISKGPYDEHLTALIPGPIRPYVLAESDTGYLIYEDVYFHMLPSGFRKYFYDIVKEMYNSKTIEREFDFRNAIKAITKEDTQNFKKFEDFLQILGNSSTPKVITLKIGFENSYSEPIELYELSTNEMKNVFGNKPFKEKLEKLAMNNSLKVINTAIDSLENFGEITYDVAMLKEFYSSNNNTYDSEDSFIGHEIRHFLIFLQRLSAMCYDVCSYKSNKEFIKTKTNIMDIYQLNENEFITLSATYIERLINLYKNINEKI